MMRAYIFNLLTEALVNRRDMNIGRFMSSQFPPQLNNSKEDKNT